MKLRGTTKFLLVCWTAAGVIAGTVHIIVMVADARLAKHVKECQATRVPSTRKIALRDTGTGLIQDISPEDWLRNPWKYEAPDRARARRVDIPGIGIVEFPGQMTDSERTNVIVDYIVSACDSWELVRLADFFRLAALDYEPMSGIQAQVLNAHRQVQARTGWSFPAFVLAAAIASVGVIPWGWYFLLDRIREVANAIRGQGRGDG